MLSEKKISIRKNSLKKIFFEKSFVGKKFCFKNYFCWKKYLSKFFLKFCQKKICCKNSWSLMNPSESFPKVSQIPMNPFPNSPKFLKILSQSLANPHKSFPKVSWILLFMLSKSLTNPHKSFPTVSWILMNPFPTKSGINTALIFIDMHMNIGTICWWHFFYHFWGFSKCSQGFTL